MDRRPVGLVLAMSLLSGAVVAQTPEKIADAIERLDGPREDARAIEFLIDAGKPAVEPLVAELNRSPEDPENPRFERMLRVLSAIGPDATGALPALVDLLIDERFQEERIATTAVPIRLNQAVSRICVFAPDQANELRSVLVAADRTPTPKGHVHEVRSPLIRRLELVAGFRVRHSRPPALASSDVNERLLALDLIDADDRAALPQLVAMLEDDQQPRGTAASARTRAWIPLPQSVANRVVWDSVSSTIARIDPDHPKAARGLALRIGWADDPRDRIEATAALGRQGAAAKEHADILVKALDSDDDRLVAEAVTALGMIRVDHDEVVDRIRSLTEDPRPAIAERAKAALRALEKWDDGPTRTARARAREVRASAPTENFARSRGSRCRRRDSNPH